MPYEWTTPAPDQSRLHLWPYRSLSRSGFVWFIGATAGLIALPLPVLIGSKVLWGLLPFLVLAVAGIWWALERSYRDAEIVEDLAISTETVTLTRHGPRGQRQDWQANRHWVRVILHPKSGPVPDYLTLQGGPREVELGAFLTPEERKRLLSDLRAALSAA